jgi:hypothetical protein
LIGDKGYFPDDKKYKEYLTAAGDSTEVSAMIYITTSNLINIAQKSTCAYLDVVNSQNKSKFKSMTVTGVVACECRHGFLKSMVDLQKGEKFVISLTRGL